MYRNQTSQRYDWKPFFRNPLIGAGLLILLSLLGCFHTPQVIEDKEVSSPSRIRPIDTDISIVRKIGYEALEKFGYEEINKLADRAGFIEYKTEVKIQVVSYDSAVATGFTPVFSRYAVAAAVASQADSPLPGPADIAAVGVVVIGIKGAPKPAQNFELPTNPPQFPPAEIPSGWRVRQMSPTEQYPNGYWKLEKPMKDGSWQPIDPSTMKPGTRPQTHIEFPSKKPE